jgi:hypothetical protein
MLKILELSFGEKRNFFFCGKFDFFVQEKKQTEGKQKKQKVKNFKRYNYFSPVFPDDCASQKFLCGVHKKILNDRQK